MAAAWLIAAPALSSVMLRSACEALLAIAARPAEDGCQLRHEFTFGGLPLGEELDAPVHRCLSAPEARVKLDTIEGLTGRPLARLLDGWEQLPVATLWTLERVIGSLDAHERQRGTVGQPEDWCRLDELFFRLSFRAWLDGVNFAPAPHPRVVARQIDLEPSAYQACLQRLRDELVRPTWEDCQPRVDLWLGDPPRQEAGAHAPRLWVSARCHRHPPAAAARHGLLPANTAAQAQAARAAIYQRWMSREDDEDDEPTLSAHPPASPHYTLCRRCGRLLAVAAQAHVPRGLWPGLADHRSP